MKRFLRFANCESLVPNDRLQRIRPFIDQVRDLCQRKYIPSRHVAVDESLMLYKGRLVRIDFSLAKNIKYLSVGIQTIQSSKKSSLWHQNFCFV